jgi:hypothetical protein
VLERAGNLGLGDEPLAADDVVGVPLQDLLERYLAMQLTKMIRRKICKLAGTE